MRETKRANIYVNGEIVKNVYLNNNGEYDVLYNKLGQLEDIEEELGVDLIDLLSKEEVLLLLFNYIRNIPFLFDPRKENDK